MTKSRKEQKERKEKEKEEEEEERPDNRVPRHLHDAGLWSLAHPDEQGRTLRRTKKHSKGERGSREISSSPKSRKQGRSRQTQRSREEGRRPTTEGDHLNQTEGEEIRQIKGAESHVMTEEGRGEEEKRDEISMAFGPREKERGRRRKGKNKDRQKERYLGHQQWNKPAERERKDRELQREIEKERERKRENGKERKHCKGKQKGVDNSVLTKAERKSNNLRRGQNMQTDSDYPHAHDTSTTRHTHVHLSHPHSHSSSHPAPYLSSNQSQRNRRNQLNRAERDQVHLAMAMSLGLIEIDNDDGEEFPATDDDDENGEISFFAANDGLANWLTVFAHSFGDDGPRLRRSARFDQPLSYEQLSQLEDVVVGCTPQQIDCLPTFKYVKEENKSEANESTCAICLNDFSDGQVLLLLPCVHRFCDTCIKSWLARSKKCPTCKCLCF